MPRANRYYLPGHIWHITQRCHKKEFLLKFAKDRNRLRYWIFEAKKRFDLSVLNYTITSNHIHLLILDRGTNEIPKSMQLLAGRIAQEYNHRKNRKGAFWQDRYHATAIDTGSYLAQCIVYIDLNMVRAGVVQEPHQWQWCGYNEIQFPPERYKIIDSNTLMKLFNVKNFNEYQILHRSWINNKLQEINLQREASWSSCLAIGGENYINKINNQLNIDCRYKKIIKDNEIFKLEEQTSAYTHVFNV